MSKCFYDFFVVFVTGGVQQKGCRPKKTPVTLSGAKHLNPKATNKKIYVVLSGSEGSHQENYEPETDSSSPAARQNDGIVGTDPSVILFPQDDGVMSNTK